MAFHLRKLEFDLQQKAATRHYVLLAVYIVSIIALKFDDIHQIWKFNHATTPTEIASVSPAPVSSPPTLAMNTVQPQPPAAMPAALPIVRNTRPRSPIVTAKAVQQRRPAAVRTAKATPPPAVKSFKAKPKRTRSR